MCFNNMNNNINHSTYSQISKVSIHLYATVITVNDHSYQSKVQTEK